MHREDLKPREVRRSEDGTFVVDWSDGHQSTYSPERLRRGCPCASCREERTAVPPGEFLRDVSPAAFRVERWERTGNYAMSIQWGDGHGAGIFSWPVLRDLCDCVSCRIGRGEAG